MPRLWTDTFAEELPTLGDERLREIGAFANYIVAECGYMAFRILSSTRYAAVWQLAYTAAIIEGTIGDRAGYSRRWCFEDLASAVQALNEWDGAEGTEPEGWHRSPHDGRRRPDGDASREYVRW